MLATISAALLCSAISFYVMPFERALPRPPAPERIEWDHSRSRFHNMKNITTEYVRADAQWWSKFLCFIILHQLIAIIALVIIK